jgi:hypothetical protein
VRVDERAGRLDIAVGSHRLHGQRFGSPSAPLVLGLHGLSLEVPRSAVVEVDANHLTINAHPDTAAAMGTFLADVVGPGRIRPT